MLLAPVLTVIRASGFGSVFGVAALLIGGCSVLPNEGDALRVKRVEEAVLPMARVALEAEQIETAKRLYLRLLDVDPGSVKARMGLGDIAVERRDSAEAARWYAAAVAHARRADERQEALLAHGRAALSGGALEAARKSFSRLTSPREGAPTPSVAWGLNGLGLVALLEGDIRAAIGLMEQAVLLAPEESRLSDNLSRALDLSAGMAPESASADQLRGMAAEPDSALLGNGRDARESARESPPATIRTDAGRKADPRPTEAERPRPGAETVRGEDETPDETTGEMDRTRAERERQGPESDDPGVDVRGIDKSELRPYAIKVGGEYYVRIGAYAIPDAARAVASELGRVTTELVDVVEFGMGNGRNAVRLYRVLVGPIATEAGLIELVAALDDLGYGAARVPPSVASESRAEKRADPAMSAGQRSAGPELVELSLDPGRDDTDEPPTTAGEVGASRQTEHGAATVEPEEAPTVPDPPVPGEIAKSGVDVEASGIDAELSGTDAEVPGTDAEAASGEAREPAASDGATMVGDAGRARRVGDRDAESGDIAIAPEHGAPPAAEPEEEETVTRPAEEAPSSADPSGDPSADPSGISSGNPFGDPGPVETTERRGSSPADVAASEMRSDAEARFLQVGAYTVRSAAEALAAEVGRVARAPVRVVEAELADGETMYRVQVGPVGSPEAMAELGELLISGGYGTVRILPEPEGADGDEGFPPFPPPPVSLPPERRVRAFMVDEGGGRFLQMGAYAVRATADTLASQLRLVTSEPVFVDATPNDGGDSLFRVRIGPITSDASLANLLGALRSGYGAGWALPSVETDVGRTAFVVHGDSERFLQMGAYATRSAANALVAELRGRIDGEIRVTEVPRDGKPLYRVRIGPIVSDGSLLALVEAARSLGYVVD